MHPDKKLYRQLQRHLDRQPIGFPATISGSDLKLLRRLFSEDEARLALCLDHAAQSTAAVAARAGTDPAATLTRLTAMLEKGSIGWRQRAGADYWHLLPLVVGMYEGQDGRPTREFLKAAGAYLRSPAFGASFLAVRPPQMRTIPVGKAIAAEHHVATYERIDDIVRTAREPLVVLPCICRAGEKMRRCSCRVTEREETCIAFGDMAAAVLRRGHGRMITRDEALAIFRQNEEDGLVLQPSNAREPGFVCSCCGCCCGMLKVQKMLPRPADFWTNSFCATVEGECVRCGKCVPRCQVGALSMAGAGGSAQVSRSRCIGCGLCVPVCPARVLRLYPRAGAAVPPRDEQELHSVIRENKKSAPGRWWLLAKTLLRFRR